MKRILLISCVSRKGDKKAKAKDLYLGALFTNSMAYAKTLNPNKIFILSALHHLVDPEQEIEPYNVTLSYVPPDKKTKNPELKVLTKKEAKLWGQIVIEQLKKETDLENDEFILLAGQSYVKQIKNSLTRYEEPLKGLKIGERIKHLASKLKEQD